MSNNSHKKTYFCTKLYSKTKLPSSTVLYQNMCVCTITVETRREVFSISLTKSFKMPNLQESYILHTKYAYKFKFSTQRYIHTVWEPLLEQKTSIPRKVMQKNELKKITHKMYNTSFFLLTVTLAQVEELSNQQSFYKLFRTFLSTKKKKN